MAVWIQGQNLRLPPFAPRTRKGWGTQSAVLRTSLRAASGGLYSLVRVHEVAKLFGWLEVGNTLGGDFDALAGLGVAPDAGIPLTDAERPKTSNLNFVSALQSADHRAEDGLNNDFAITSRQVTQAGYLFYQVCFCHNL